MKLRAAAFSGIITKHHIVYSKDADEVKVEFSDEIGGTSELVSYKRRGKPVSFKTLELPVAYMESLGIDKKKKGDLLKL